MTASMTPRPVFVTLVVALTLIGSTVAAHADLSTGLVAHYPFDGNANDATGGGRNGTVVGATFVADRLGNPNSAYHFDGQGNHIVCDGDGLPTGERTVAVWFRADDLATNPVMVGYGGSSLECGTSWFMGANAARAFFMSSHCNVNTILFENCSPTIGEWNHFAVATDATGTRVYINGVLFTENTNPVTNTATTSTQLGIGVASAPDGSVPYADGSIGYFAGDLDDVRIYDRALSDVELQTLAAGATPVGCCAPTPAAGCRAPASTKAVLKIKVEADDATKNLLLWKWVKGAATSKAEFGSPTTTDNYYLCVYDDGEPVLTKRIPAAGTCASTPCWKDLATGYQFKNKDLAPNGAFLLQLKEGASDGDAKVRFKGKGSLLSPPAPDGLTGPVAVQLSHGGDAVCWGATFSAPFKKQDAAGLTGKSD